MIANKKHFNAVFRINFINYILSHFRFDCGACGKRFKEKCAVENHIRLVHENKFRYNCKVCGAGYRSSKPFKDHMLLQHGVQK